MIQTCPTLELIQGLAGTPQEKPFYDVHIARDGEVWRIHLRGLTVLDERLWGLAMTVGTDNYSVASGWKSTLKTCFGLNALLDPKPVTQADIDYWNEIIDYAESGRVAIVKGHCFILGDYIEDVDEAKRTRFVGRDGKEFRFQFEDGHEVVTNDCWEKGEVPDWVRSQLPDNAALVTSDPKEQA